MIHTAPIAGTIVLECACKSGIALKTKKDGNGFYLSCRSYPDCKVAVWFPNSVKQATVVNEYCQKVIWASTKIKRV